jgi:hypothetical protein
MPHRAKAAFAFGLLWIKLGLHLAVSSVPREYSAEVDAQSNSCGRGAWVFTARIQDPSAALGARSMLPSLHNAKCPQYHSMFDNEPGVALPRCGLGWIPWRFFPGSGIGRCWCFPPHAFMCCVLYMLYSDRTEVCLIVPSLPGATVFGLACF